MLVRAQKSIDELLARWAEFTGAEKKNSNNKCSLLSGFSLAIGKKVPREEANADN